MSLQLDARQRAMLEEMGVKIFGPAAPPAIDSPPPPALVRTDPPRPAVISPPPLVAAPAVRTLAASPESMDWNALQQAVSAWAGERRRKPVFGIGDLRADWLCIGDPPVEDEEHEGLPFAGEPGRLLDNMLAAVGVSRRQGAYLTNVLKCRLPSDRAQEAAEVEQSLAFLQRQVELLQPRVILVMGRFAVQALLQTNEPPGKLRGEVHRYLGVPVVVTFHPAYLLRTPADKGRAWVDLCLARSLLGGGP